MKIVPSVHDEEKGNKAQEKKSEKNKTKGILKGKDNLSRKNARTEAVDSNNYRFESSPMSKSAKRNLREK